MTLQFNATHYSGHKRRLRIVGNAMEAEIAWIASAFVGILFRQVMRFQQALAELAGHMAVAENSRAAPISYQNSITPPWLPNLWILLAAGVVGLVVAAGYYSGVWGAAVAVIALLAGMLASGMASMALSRPRALTYYRYAFHVLANREADFRRDGDIARANAAEHFQFLMSTVIGPQLRQ
jgi:hypothetical protein